jgi:hypothetical protein
MIGGVVEGKVVMLSLHMYACRVIQKALEVLPLKYKVCVCMYVCIFV